ncbi:DUF938 domain-containing protein [Rheinheimera sp. WS51]|uniref:DUF938 domain-containing protein n=1 Tax=Rheinheimera sp. WS51 TaxID=3425886 RepID=UPI003D8EB9DA
MSEQFAFSQACENNKAPILDVLAPILQHSRRVLEVGGGTGQHAVFFGQHFATKRNADQEPLIWQSSDQAAYLPDLAARINHANLSNLLSPIELDVTSSAFTVEKVDAVFSANTLHIMSWPVVQRFFQRLDEFCHKKAQLCIYGPFNYQGQFTSDSNVNFDQYLKQRDPLMGIRDIEQVIALAQQLGFTLEQDYAMPANNRLLHFKR